MSAFLIDTNVVSEFVRPEPSLKVRRWFEAADPESLFASVITFGEIRLGIEGLPLGKRRAALEQWIDEGVPEWFQTHLLPVTKAIADRWGKMTIQARLRGLTVSTADGLIAATAIEHGVKDFGGLDLPVFNPWEE